MNRNYLTKKKLMLALFTCFLKFSFAITIPGSGTITNPYRISTINELKQFRDNINSSTYNNAYKSKYYELANDIDMSSETTWKPIGYVSNKFEGNFNGKGFTIKNLKIGSADNLEVSNYCGFFGNIKNAIISNLNVEMNIYCNGKYIGGITGYADLSTIMNCSTNGYIYAYGNTVRAGGILGEANSGKINNCSSIIKINAQAVNASPLIANICTGGISGISNLNSIFNSSSNVEIMSKSELELGAGGISGSNNSWIVNCFSTGNITCETTNSSSVLINSGGISGSAKIVRNTYSNCTINSKGLSTNSTILEGGISGTLALDSTENNISLNDSLIATNLNQNTKSGTWIYKIGILSNGSVGGSWSNYATNSTVIKVENGTTLSTVTGDGIFNGTLLNNDPVNYLNDFVSINPICYGIELKKWVVVNNINNGYPIFENSLTSIEEYKEIPVSISIRNSKITIDGENIKHVKCYGIDGTLIYYSNNYAGTKIETQQLPKNIYIVNVIFENGIIISKKIAII
jgi:hypothetical protein